MSRKSTRFFRPQLEVLEVREQPALASFSLTNAGVLDIKLTSSGANQNVLIATEGRNLVVVDRSTSAPAVKSVPLSSVSAIEVSIPSGNDTVRYASGGNSWKPFTVYAGSGKDTVIGGDGTNYLYGGTGSDTLVGGPGSDYLFAGTGSDTLIGGAGNDEYLFRASSTVGTDVISETRGKGTDTAVFDASAPMSFAFNAALTTPQQITSFFTVRCTQANTIEHVVERNAALPGPIPFGSSTTEVVDPASAAKLDSNGVLEVYNVNVGWYHSPTRIATYVQGLYNAWLMGDARVFPQLQANANWLLNNAIVTKDFEGRPFAYYTFPFPDPPLDMPAGWRSALTAGDAIAALYASSKVLGNSKMATRATQLLDGFNLTPQQGGYRVSLGDPLTVWYEEVADPAVHVNSNILNGHMYAIAAVYWYASASGSSSAAQIFWAGIYGLEQALPQYDVLPFSLYDLLVRDEIYKYHVAEVVLLRYFYGLTGVEMFEQYANLWAKRTKATS